MRLVVASLRGLSATDVDALGAHIINGLGVPLLPSIVKPLRSDLKALYSDLQRLTDSDRVLMLGLLASLSAPLKVLFIQVRNHDETFRNLAIAARERMDQPEESALLEALEPTDRRQIRSALS